MEPGSHAEPAEQGEAASEDTKAPTPGRPTPAVYAHAFSSDAIDPDAAKVLRRLTRYGHTAYLVGGGVRDLLLDRRPKDFDIATSARPNDVRRLFRNCRIIGRRFRLAHVLFAGGKVIEVATFRRDPQQELELLEPDLANGALVDEDATPVRLAPVNRGDEDGDGDILIRSDNVFGEPHEDAIRRDFTINGLFYDIGRGEVIDYVGGMADVERRVVRTIGDPDVRFREDPVRILRAIKFSARLDMGIDPDVYDAMVEHRSELHRAARPRVLEEVLRLMRGGAAHRSIYIAWDLGVLAELMPEVTTYLDDDAPGADLTWGRLAAADRRTREGQLPDDAVLIGALLLGPLEEALDGARDPAEAFDDFMEPLALRVALPRRLKDRLRGLVLAQPRLRAGKIGGLARREIFADALALFTLDAEARGEELPEWAQNPEIAPPEDSPTRRRRRRRRRPRRL